MIPQTSIHVYIGRKYPQREEIKAPSPVLKPLSLKYKRLCAEILAAIQSKGNAPREVIAPGLSKNDFATATWRLKDEGKIVYVGHAPHGYWRAK
jgi:hypothetical protein